jgi:hypothetical protein
MKFAQAVITKTKTGKWKIFFQSDRQVERSAVGDFKTIVDELKHASSLEWEQRSLNGE